MNPTPQVISVSEFVTILNETLSFAFPQVIIEGEVSDFRITQNKWVSFNLKDETTTLNCFMVLPQLKVPIEDGMKIRVTGGPRVYGKSGRLSFSVRGIELAGAGEIKRAFELLRRKLEGEGLFAQERKRPIPKYPQRIGLITSGDSAAYADFMKILNGRWGGITVELAHVQVQGVPAPDQIVAAFNHFNQLASPVDVVVLTRGGGSLEDLQAFNTEPVARAVAGSRTPTIVGVGHEVDTTLADFAADVRATTPTDAARLAVPDRRQEALALTERVRRMQALLTTQVVARETLLDRRLNQIEQATRRPLERVAAAQRLIQQNVTAAWARVIDQRRQLLAQFERMIRTTSPQATLARGYSIARHNGQILREASSAPAGETVMIQLAKGNLTTKVQP